MRSSIRSERSTRSRHRGPSDAGVDSSSVTSRRPYHRGLSDPITDLDRYIILASQPSDQALSWLGGECAAPQQGNGTFLHLSVGVGDTLSVFHTLGRRTKTSCTRRMVASHAVPTHKRTTLIASPELARCRDICDLKVVTFCSQNSLFKTCSRKDFSLGVAHRPHVGRVVLPMLTNAGAS